MTIRYNAKAAAEEGFERVPPGRYLCEVDNAEEKTTQNGDPMLSLRWRRIGESFTICFDNLVFSEKGRGIAHKKLKLMGAKVADSAEDVEIEAADLIGCQAWLTLRDKEHKGKKYLEPDFEAEGFGYASADELLPAGLGQELPAGAIGKPGAKRSPAEDAAFNENIPF